MNLIIGFFSSKIFVEKTRSFMAVTLKELLDKNLLFFVK